MRTEFTQAEGFRADIEGLRGVAVLMVVLGHAGVPGFAGGFIGVDVFFVISGFLITGLLIRELERSSHIDFWAFYARRARRLLPAFAPMLACTLAVIVWAAPGTDQKLQAWSAVSAALWSSNIYFSLSDFGYFESSAKDSLFLHTWSLGVEEQFYLIWPALLALTWRFFRAYSARTALTTTIAAVAGVGFLWSLAATAYWPVGAYYMMPLRLWELAAGGLCAVIPGTAIAKPVMRYAGVFGAAMLAVGCVFVSERLPYPGMCALLPVAGTALLIGAGSRYSANPTSRVLASPILLWTGRISYSWYLWHWPVLAFAHRIGQSDRYGIAIAVLASLVLACASYRFIERPTRHRPIVDARRAVLLGVLASTLLALLPSAWLSLVSSAELANRRAPTVEDRVRGMIAFPQIYAIKGCDEWYSSDRLVPCVFKGDGSPGHTAVMLGDSQGLHWFPAFQKVFADAGWTLVVLTKSSCPIVDESIFYERIHRRYTECETWRAAALAYVEQIKPDIVVVGSAGSYSFTPEQWEQGSRRTLEELRKGARHVLVLAPSPRLPFDGPGCVVGNPLLLQKEASDACSAPLEKIQDRSVMDALARATSGIGEVAILNLNDSVCPQGVCRAWTRGQLVYRDFQHLNAPFVEHLASDVSARLAPYMSDNNASSR